jgi:hypothetical protein
METTLVNLPIRSKVSQVNNKPQMSVKPISKRDESGFQQKKSRQDFLSAENQKKSAD